MNAPENITATHPINLAHEVLLKSDIALPERARESALAAVRAGAGRADVLAVVPVGVARRGAEWRGSAPQTKGD